MFFSQMYLISCTKDALMNFFAFNFYCITIKHFFMFDIHRTINNFIVLSDPFINR